MNRIIDAVCTEIKSALEIDVIIGALPANGGVSVEMQGGALSDVFNNRESVTDLTLLFLSKHKHQKTACNALWRICNRLTAKTEYPVAIENDCEWVLSKTATTPQYIGVEANGQHLYSCVVTITIHQ